MTADKNGTAASGQEPAGVRIFFIFEVSCAAMRFKYFSVAFERPSFR
jgi:hypothetical protein